MRQFSAFHRAMLSKEKNLQEKDFKVKMKNKKLKTGGGNIRKEVTSHEIFSCLQLGPSTIRASQP
jgi:hypothetical protein